MSLQQFLLNLILNLLLTINPIVFPHGFILLGITVDLKHIGIMDNTVKYGICYNRFSDLGMPAGVRELRTKGSRSAFVLLQKRKRE